MKKRKTTKFISILIISALLISSVCLSSVSDVNAGVSARKITLISALYDSLHTEGDAKRLEVLQMITGDLASAPPYAMKAIADDAAAYALADAINTKLTSDIDRNTLKTAIDDFYTYQSTHSTEASFVLRQFKEGLNIANDLYSTYGGFPTIVNGIEANTYEYLLFVNFVKEVKDIYNLLTGRNYNPLYVDGNGKVAIYQDLKDLSDIASYFTDSSRATSYKTKLEGLLETLNGTKYAALSTERPFFITNMRNHNLIDSKDRNLPDPDPDPDQHPDPGTPAPLDVPPPGTIVPETKFDTTTGIALATISEKAITDTLNGIVANSEGKKELIIEPKKVSNATAYSVDLPGSSLSSASGDVILNIKTDIGSLSVPSNMFTAAELGGDKVVQLSIGKANISNLSEDLKNQIGSRPVLELSVKVDGKTIEWNTTDVFAKISYKYTPTAEELKNPENIVVWYIDGAGKVVSVPNGRYNPLTGEVTFTTNHFSKYATAYVMKTYDDIAKYTWAKKQIEVMAAKGIINGVSPGHFTPAANITRGDFIHLLINTLNLNAKVDENFDDVSTTNYNYNTIGIAKKLGIAEGVGKNKFDPKAYITRQDMMVLAARALTIAKQLNVKGTQNELTKFKDYSKIAGYARESVADIVKANIIIGSGMEIKPTAYTTRAEAAVIMYRLYNK